MFCVELEARDSLVFTCSSEHLLFRHTLRLNISHIVSEMVDGIMFYSQTFYSIFAEAYNLRRISNIFSEALIAFTEQSKKKFNNVCRFFLNIVSK